MEDDKRLHKRLVISKEILSTEEDYIKALKICMEYYHKECKNLIDSGNLSVTIKQLNDIFMNMSNIIKINEELEKLLKIKLETWTNETTIGDDFNKIVCLSRLFVCNMLLGSFF
jgi:flagellar biosynthesis chaperone FliJ